MTSHPRSAGRRVLACAAIGLAVGAATGVATDPLVGVAAGWIAATGVYLVRAWSLIWPMDGAATRGHAETEDPSRGVAQTAVVVAAAASLVAVVFLLARAGSLTAPETLIDAGLGVLVVALSWTLVHTIATLRYADLYVRSTEATPIDFNQEAPPDYRDFAYLAFTLGMTYQVSDTNIGDAAVRRTALAHALVSFVFGVVVLASAINVLAGLMTQD